MRDGRRIGVDVGSVRVGVATCDPGGLLATPLTTLDRDESDEADLDRLALIVAEAAAVEVVVGLPRSLDGTEGPAAAAVRRYAARVAARIAPVPVRLLDERLTTVDAHRFLRDSGVPGRRQRSVVDQAAAVLILQNALDAERATGRPPGTPVRPGRPKARMKDGRR
ncbi:MAG: Holliday junction resolvase RuvX [Nostocoides sp.]